MKILIAVDESEIAEKAFHWYVSTMHKSEYEVIVCYKADPPRLPSRRDSICTAEEIIPIAKEHMERLMALSSLYEEKCKNHHLKYTIVISNAHDSPGHSIVSEAEKSKVDLIVMGRRKLGAFKRLILGSVTEYVMRNSCIPTVICPV